MRICAVVIWYKPDQNCVNNIISYIDQIEQVFIIDNSDNNNGELASNIPKSHYVANMRNLGIAAGLNIGCKLARDFGYDYCMTMDQDSFWDSNQIRTFLDEIEKNSKDLIVSYAPTYEIPYSKLSVYARLKWILFSHKNKSPFFDVDCVITSGNVIRLKVWEELDGFYEPFFIDEVDFDFCCRIIEEGYKIRKYNNIKMHQIIGNPNYSILPKETHSPSRIQYMVRNRLYMIKMHPVFCKNQRYKLNLFKLFIEILFSMNKNRIIAFFRGIKEYNSGSVGEIQW